ncbi:hypothetical protein B0H16DRAFT_1772774 [Mycena metata]|uniref:Uncharacterized protein n=1 Tax=Mycena metata TaxID=1033252 RepID=A0AAD7HZG6_9AGAR|nr:hypothetical protein B0H16DRAFT_1772774 [Mycena metata]
MRQEVSAVRLLLLPASIPCTLNAPHDDEDAHQNSIMYAGEGSSGAYYGADDKDSAGNSGYTWYAATESVASGSASLSISAPAFPPHPPTSAFLPAGPSTDWPPTHTALSSIPYYPPPAPTPNFWGNDTFLPTAFIHPVGYVPNLPQQVFHSYGKPRRQILTPPPRPSSMIGYKQLPLTALHIMRELMSASSGAELSFPPTSRASTPFSGATSSTGSWDSWPSTSSSGSSRFSSVDPGDMSEACGLSSLDPEDARRFVDNDTELRFAEDAPGPKVSRASFGDPAPPISAHKRKKVSKKKNNLPTDLGRLEDLDWHPSDTVWLDEGVSSEYVEFPQSLKLTSQKAIFRLERVTGIPSELPHFEIATAFILSIPKGDFPKNMTPDNAFRNLVLPTLLRIVNRGRSAVDTRVSGFFFGRDPDERIETRRATPKCRGVYVCSAIDKTFVNTPRRALDPELMEKLVQATLRQREQQDDTLVGQVLSFIRAIKKVYCRGVRPDGTRCPGTVSAVRRLFERTNGKVHGLRCTEAHTPLAPASSHSSNAILVDEALFLKASAGERIVEEADDAQLCAAVVSVRNMSGTVTDCDFNHSKDGRPFTAKLELVRCGARITFFCPYEETYGDEKKYGDLVRTMIAFPDPGHCHSHPTALGTKCPSTAREKYKEAARRFGPGGTVAKIENAASTKLIFGTATPGEYNSSLLNTALKNRLLREVRSESSFAGDSAADALASYVAQQQAISDPDKRYLHSIMWRDGKRIIFGARAALLRRIHQFRALDVDTTYKPVKGKLQVFVISGWLASQNRALTVMRVWMEVHNEPSFKLAWTEIFRLVLLLTGQPLHFKRVHRGGKILGLLSDMEAAPLLGFASALWEEMTPEYRAKIGDVDGIADLKHLSEETRSRMQQLRHLRSPAELAEFAAWLGEIDDPTGRVETWWKHKMHHWLLPALIPYLFKIGDDFDLLEPNTNLGEGQHRWNNIQTGVDMTTIESLMKYEQLDISVESQLHAAERTGDLRNTRNNLVHRYISRSNHRIAAHEKYKHTRVVDAKVRLREVTVAETQSRLKKAKAKAAVESDPSPRNQAKVKGLHQRLRDERLSVKKAKAEAKSNSSGRVHSSHRIGSRKLAFLHTSGLAAPALSPPAQSPERELSVLASSENVVSPPPAPKKTKKLDLEWKVKAEGKIFTVREYAHHYPQEFAMDYAEYLHLL